MKEDFIQDIVAEIGKVKNNRIPLEEFVSEKCSADAFRNITVIMNGIEKN